MEQTDSFTHPEPAEQPAEHHILIADDDAISRRILIRMLGEDYRVDEASDGDAALRMLNAGEYALLICDITMPVMDGWRVLETVRGSERLRALPVIMISSEGSEASTARAFDMGADDVALKPFIPQIVRSRVAGIIRKAESARVAEKNRLYEMRFQQQADMLRAAEHDEVTGLRNKQGFRRRARVALHDAGSTRMLLLRWNIDNFKTYNDVYGVQAGNRLLSQVGAYLRDTARPGEVYARWEADHFVKLMPAGDMPLESMAAPMLEWFAGCAEARRYGCRMGIYEVDDPALDVDIMCDRALLAIQASRGSQTQRVACFDESMRQRLLDQQKMEADVRAALNNHEFIPYYQPQYDLYTGHLSGVEALARWLPPGGDLVPPATFIPMMEKNGLITELDMQIAEQVCVQLADWEKRGLPAVPVSVNISRIDIFSVSLLERLCTLTDRYCLGRDRLHIEITESAYMDNPAQLINMVASLSESHFLIEMDDFGSGYSSLNALKNIPVDTIKLDLRFLDMKHSDGRGGIILNAMVQMAHWLGLRVIAEGVETANQAAYLKSVGCRYAQGFFLARPMCAQELETLLLRQPVLPDTNVRDVSRFFDSRGFWDPDAQASIIFNTLVGGAAILEFDGEALHIQRFNDRFLSETGMSGECVSRLRDRMLDCVLKEDRARLLACLEDTRSRDDESEIEARWCFPGDRQDVWLHLKMRRVASNESRVILYVGFENTTRQKEMQRALYVKSEEMRLAMAQMGGLICEYDAVRHVLTVPPEYARKHGIDQCLSDIPDGPLRAVMEEDQERYRAFYHRVAQGEQSAEVTVRVRCTDGSAATERLRAHIICDDEGHADHALISVEDMTDHIRRSELIQKLGERLRVQESMGSYNAPIVERVFHTLYEADDTPDAVHAILQVLCEHYGLSRAFVCENEPDECAAHVTMQWHAVGAAVNDLSGARFDYPDGVQAYRALFNQDMVFSRNLALEPNPLPPSFSQAGVQSFLQAAMLDKGRFIGFVSFDVCHPGYVWTGEQTDTLALCARMIAAFIVKYRREQNAAFSDDFLTALDSSASYIYIVDPENHRVAFANRAINEYLNGDYRGVCCYRDFMHRDQPCAECPIARAQTGGKPVMVELCRPDGLWLLTEAMPLLWRGRHYVMMTCMDIARYKRLEAEWMVRGEEYLAVTAQSGRHICRYRLAQKTLECMPQTAARYSLPAVMSGYPESAVVCGLVAAESTDAFLALHIDMRAGKPTGACHTRLRMADGGYAWHQMTYTLINGENGAPRHAIIVFYDDSERIERELAFDKWKSDLNRMRADSTSFIEVNLTDDRIENVEGMVKRLLDSDTRAYSVLAGRGANAMTNPEDARLFAETIDRARLLRLYESGVREDGMEFRQLVESREMWTRMSIMMARHPFSGDVQAYMSFSDVTENHLKMDALSDAAARDSLTRLYNRDAFAARVHEALSALPEDTCYAVYMIDLDHFKRVNDTLGHRQGDDALIKAACAIERVMTDGIAARIGGDEFMAFSAADHSEEDVHARATQLLRALQMSVGGLDVSASVGVLLSRNRALGFEDMYLKSDTALYTAKRAGKNRCHLTVDSGPAAPPAERDILDTVELKTLLEYMDGGVVLADVTEDIRICYISPSVLTVMGLTEETAGSHGERLLSHVYPPDLPGVQAAVTRCAHSREPFTHTYRAGYDGRYWQQLRGVPLPGFGEKHHMLIGVITDVTALKRGEAHALEMEYACVADACAQLLADSCDAVYQIDYAARTVTVRAAHGRSVPPDARPLDDEIDRLCRSLQHPDQCARVRDFFGTLFSAVAPDTLDVTLNNPDGTVRDVHLVYMPIGKSGALVCCRDVTRTNAAQFSV